MEETFHTEERKPQLTLLEEAKNKLIAATKTQQHLSIDESQWLDKLLTKVMREIHRRDIRFFGVKYDESLLYKQFTLLIPIYSCDLSKQDKISLIHQLIMPWVEILNTSETKGKEDFKDSGNYLKTRLVDHIR